jgi:hypothetical protein
MTGFGVLAVALVALSGYGQDAAPLVAAGDDCARQQDYRGALARYAQALAGATQTETRVDLHRSIPRTHLAGQDAAAARAE